MPLKELCARDFSWPVKIEVWVWSKLESLGQMQTWHAVLCLRYEIITYFHLFEDIQRRSLEYEERKYLVEMGYVTETQSNLGLLAVRSDDVLGVMQEEYPAKYKVSCI